MSGRVLGFKPTCYNCTWPYYHGILLLFYDEALTIFSVLSNDLNQWYKCGTMGFQLMYPHLILWGGSKLAGFILCQKCTMPHSHGPWLSY